MVPVTHEVCAPVTMRVVMAESRADGSLLKWIHVAGLLIGHAMLVLVMLAMDWATFSSPITPVRAFRAVADNATHAAIAAVVWLLVEWLGVACHHDSADMLKATDLQVERLRRTPVAELMRAEFVGKAVACGVVASLMDLDHFVMASSLRLEDATSLESRPVLHSSTAAVMLVSACALLVARCCKARGRRPGATRMDVPLLLLAALSSHQVGGLACWIECLAPHVLSQLRISSPHMGRRSLIDAGFL